MPRIWSFTNDVAASLPTGLFQHGPSNYHSGGPPSSHSLFSQHVMGTGNAEVFNNESWCGETEHVPGMEKTLLFKSGRKRSIDALYPGEDDNDATFRSATHRKLNDSSYADQDVSRYFFPYLSDTVASSQPWGVSAQPSDVYNQFLSLRASISDLEHSIPTNAYPSGLESETPSHLFPGISPLPSMACWEQTGPFELMSFSDYHSSESFELSGIHLPLEGDERIARDRFAESATAIDHFRESFCFPKGHNATPLLDVLQQSNSDASSFDMFPTSPLNNLVQDHSQRLEEDTCQTTNIQQIASVPIQTASATSRPLVVGSCRGISALPDGYNAESILQPNGGSDQVSSLCVVHETGNDSLLSTKRTPDRRRIGRQGPFPNVKASRVAKTRENRSVCLLCKIRKIEVGGAKPF